jgi:hypothetical protein
MVWAEMKPAKNISSVKMNINMPITPFGISFSRRTGSGLCSN